jgi:hypothetical protein
MSIRFTHQHTGVFRQIVDRFQDDLLGVVVLTYTLDVLYAQEFHKYCGTETPLLVIYGSHKHKKEVSLKSMKNSGIMYRLASPRHGRMHAKMLLLVGKRSTQLCISTANFASNQRSQNAFWSSPVLRRSKYPQKTPFQQRLVNFFQCFDGGILEALRQTLNKPIDSLLNQLDFSAIASYIHLVTTTPAGCSRAPTGLAQIRKIMKPETHKVTLQPTSFGAHLDADFWTNIQSAFGIGSDYRIVTPKLCVYSKIQRKRLQCVPEDVRQHFEDFRWKNRLYNKIGNYPNVPHFKLYYGETNNNKISWLLFTSMSLSLGACGRDVCPNNMYCIYKNRCCKCNQPKQTNCKTCFCGRNFEMGIMFTKHLEGIEIPFV